MALVQNFNVNPYYDDYDEDKKFLRMLFRPGYAVQARELTQLQTILQKQVSRFGKHIFKNGSVVTGGEVSLSTSVVYHKLQTTTSAGVDIDVTNFLGKSIGSATSLAANSALGKVVAVSTATETDPPTLFVEYKTALQVQDGESLYTIDSDQYEARLIGSSSSGKAASASVNDGVYFIDDFFVKVTSQTIILEKYGNAPTYRIGLAYEESIVDEKTDTSLLDPALNASNFQAPGSTRYKVNLSLDKRALNSTDDTKFIEILRVESGIITLRNNYPLYSELEKTLARRTYDESGNYTVKPFTIYLKDHIPNAGNTSNASLFTAKLSVGKAYVRGHEIETVSPINLELERAREKTGVQNYDIAANYGNYITVANTRGLFDVGTVQAIDLHCVVNGNIAISNTTTYNSTKIGTARIREVEYVSAANTLDDTSYKYNFYLYDTRFVTLSANCSGSGNTNHIVLSNTAGQVSNVANAYSNAFIRISGGYGADNVKHKIINYNHLTKTAAIADVFAILKYSWDSLEAAELNKRIFETIYFHAVKKSAELAQVYGSYEFFDGSPASFGILQYDMWNVKPITDYDWDGLKEMVKKGMRNSLLVAPMPTASTAQILGNNEAFEPFTSNIYSRKVISGDFTIVNKYLYKDLKDLGLWSQDIVNKIILAGGSIQSIDGIPENIKNLYKTVWEISQKTLIDMSVDRGAFIDQSQSLNLFIAKPTISKLSSMHLYSWKRGSKNGIYYLRSKPATEAVKFSIMKEVETKDDEGCVSCGS